MTDEEDEPIPLVTLLHWRESPAIKQSSADTEYGVTLPYNLCITKPYYLNNFTAKCCLTNGVGKKAATRILRVTRLFRLNQLIAFEIDIDT